MATQTFTVLPQANRSGQLQSPAVDWPANVTAINIRMDSTTYTDPAITTEMTVEESRDGGTTWQFMGGTTAQGGGHDRQGNPANPGLRIQLQTEEIGTPRKIRGKINVSAAVRYGLLVDVYS